MTAINKDLIHICSGWISYGPSNKFIARFKYGKGGIKSFIKFLVENFTEEEYFGRLDAGESPLKVLESKGYLLPHIKTMLRKEGYPVTVAGWEMYIKSRTAAY
jgi:hypothetical protein